MSDPWHLVININQSHTISNVIGCLGSLYALDDFPDEVSLILKGTYETNSYLLDLEESRRWNIIKINEKFWDFPEDSWGTGFITTNIQGHNIFIERDFYSTIANLHKEYDFLSLNKTAFSYNKVPFFSRKEIKNLIR